MRETQAPQAQRHHRSYRIQSQEHPQKPWKLGKTEKHKTQEDPQKPRSHGFQQQKEATETTQAIRGGNVKEEKQRHLRKINKVLLLRTIPTMTCIRTYTLTFYLTFWQICVHQTVLVLTYCFGNMMFNLSGKYVIGSIMNHHVCYWNQCLTCFNVFLLTYGGFSK